MTEDMQYDGPPPIDELTGEMVVFVMFGREIIGVVTGYRGNRVLIDAGAACCYGNARRRCKRSDGNSSIRVDCSWRYCV